MTLPPRPHSVSTLQQSWAESLGFSQTREQGQVIGRGLMGYVVILFPKHSACASQEGLDYVGEQRRQGRRAPPRAASTGVSTTDSCSPWGFPSPSCLGSARTYRNPTSCRAKPNSEQPWELGSGREEGALPERRCEAFLTPAPLGSGDANARLPQTQGWRQPVQEPGSRDAVYTGRG